MDWVLCSKAAIIRAARLKKLARDLVVNENCSLAFCQMKVGVIEKPMLQVLTFFTG